MERCQPYVDLGEVEPEEASDLVMGYAALEDQPADVPDADIHVLGQPWHVREAARVASPQP